jgi:hypothetical protein
MALCDTCVLSAAVAHFGHVPLSYTGNSLFTRVTPSHLVLKLALRCFCHWIRSRPFRLFLEREVGPTNI